MTALARQVEQACLNAWPSLRSALHGDWLLRFGEGLSRRTNSVNPRHDGVTTIAADLDDFAEAYRARGLPLIVRVPALLAGASRIDRELDQRGFQPRRRGVHAVSRVRRRSLRRPACVTGTASW